MFLKNLRFRSKLLILMLIPALAYVVMAGSQALNEGIYHQELTELTLLTELSSQNSALVHELQKERGATAGFLGTKGSKFSDELTLQRNLTNEVKTSWQSFILSSTFKSKKINDLITSISTKIKEITKIRQQVNAFRISTPDAIRFYTQLNAQLLDVATTVAALSSDAELTKRIVAYYNFLQSKERAGIERAVLSNTFGGDKFAPQMYEKFIALVSQQETFVDIFLSMATADSRDYYNKQMNTEATEEVLKLRSIAKKNATTGNFNVDGVYWFEQATLRINQLKNVEAFLTKDVLNYARSSQAKVLKSLTMNIIMVVVILTLLIATSAFIIRTLMKQVSSLVDTMTTVRESQDLRVRADDDSADELGDIAGSLNNTLENFASTVKQISSTSIQLASSAEQSTNVVAENALAIEAGELEVSQLATAIEEMTATAQDIARNTLLAADSAQAASEQTTSGYQVVSAASKAILYMSEEVERLGSQIGRLHASSNNITNVVDVIKNVAEQTNLLALNAAIEAARAGEQGRGFAVVADEVRTLAQRTQASTLEIESIVSELQNESNTAIDAVNDSKIKADEAVVKTKNVEVVLDKITTSIEEINGMTQQIATAAEEQVAVTDEISRNITNIDNQMKQSSVGADEISQTSKEQARLAVELQTVATSYSV